MSTQTGYLSSIGCWRRGMYGLIATWLTLSIILFSLIGSTAHAVETGGYPWADATHLSIPPAADRITWGYTTRTDCSRHLAGSTCNAATLGTAPAWTFRDPWGYDLRNCTSYVAWRINKEFGKTVAGWGDASNWARSAAKAGYIVDATPEPGDIAQWDNGHVAFVEEVLGGGAAARVKISEYNQAMNGLYASGRVTTAPHYIDVNGTGNTLSKPIIQAVQATATIATPQAALPTLIPNSSAPLSKM